MKHSEFMQRIIYQFGDWEKDEKRGITKQAAEFRKKQFSKKIIEMYDEDDLNTLWDRVVINCEYKPSITGLNKLIPGRKRVQHITGFEPSKFGLEDEYSTETGKYLGSKLKDFMKLHKMDKKGTVYDMNESDRQELLVRSTVFWDKLIGSMKTIPDGIKKKVFHPERCKGCGKRIGEEREKGETYCDLCGSNILDPTNVMRDTGDGQIGKMIVNSITQKNQGAITAPKNLQF
jgi:hypothetical protein